MDSVGLKKKVRIWEVKEVLERMGKEGGAGRTWSEHTTFLKEFILLKMLPQCLLSEGRGPPHQKYQIYHSGNHVIVMTTFKEPTQSLFCKALMLMPIIQATPRLHSHIQPAEDAHKQRSVVPLLQRDFIDFPSIYFPR